MGSSASVVLPQDGSKNSSGAPAITSSTSQNEKYTVNDDSIINSNNNNNNMNQHDPLNEQQQKKKKKKKKKDLSNLSGPAWVEAKCHRKKQAWKNCVGGWYDQRFIKGTALEGETASDYNCDEMFEQYKKCYVHGMAQQLQQQQQQGKDMNKNNNNSYDGEDTISSSGGGKFSVIKPGSLLDEYLQETKED